MKMITRTIFLFAVALMLLRPAPAAPSHDATFSKKGLFKADVNQLHDTQLVAHPDAPLPPGVNVLWCGTLQLAWNEAMSLVGEKLVFSSPSPVADLLNREDFTGADLDPASYVAIADFERNDVEDKIRAALEKTFAGSASPELIPPKPDHPGPDDFVAYAYLYKNLAFADPFIDGQMTFAGHDVQEFGFGTDADSALTDQVQVYDYRSADDFVIALTTKSPKDQLILAKVTPDATLQATIHDVLARMAGHAPEGAGESDRLAVPKLNFDLRHDFGELEGLILTPSPAAKIKDPLVITKAEQLVRFQLDEKGAVLKSEAVIVMKALAMRATRPPYELVFDQPFLILLKQADSAQPYLAIWIGNPTLLVAAKKP